MVNKSIKLFTPWKVDAAPVIEQTFSGIVDGLSKHVSSEEYSRMLEEQRVGLVAQIIELELVQPCLKVFKTNLQNRSRLITWFRFGMPTHRPQTSPSVP